MRLLMEVEARVNQADGLHKNEVSFLNLCFRYLLCMLAIHLSFLKKFLTIFNFIFEGD